MVQLVLEGDTLGKRHQHYNKALKEKLADEQSTAIEKINFVDSDVDNLLRIDLANSKKNVEYILEVLKSEDLLYVSRAIKRCTWLITDPQYAHIVNPDYLHTQLFPQMTTKATNKLMLHIRLHLKDEARVEAFCNHLKTINEESSLKWLPNCSIAFIEHVIEQYQGEIEVPLLKRLCERSVSILEIHIRTCKCYKWKILQETVFLIHTSPQKYFDIIDAAEAHRIPHFGPKSTSLIMKKCPLRILDNFSRYCGNIDLETFAKCLDKTTIKAFLLNQCENESMQSWLHYNNVKHFIRYIPKDGRFEFLKNVFFEKNYKVETVKTVTYYTNELLLYSADSCGMSTNVYRWYRYAPFKVALADLKKLIRTESSAAERNAMLEVLVTCASRNMQHIHTLIQYYHDKHINEPLKFKIKFVNKLLTQTDTYNKLFDHKTWSILNTIFCSMEVYTESESDLLNSIHQFLLVYKVLHNDKVPEIIEKKFKFNTLKMLQKKLTEEEKDKLFTHLFNNLALKIDSKNVQHEVEFAAALRLLEAVLNLLRDWNRDLQDYPLVIQEIMKLIKIKICNSWAGDLSLLYNIKKSWRKHFFEYSLTLSPTEETCVNALKHDPKLLEMRRSEIEALCRNDSVPLDRLLSKLRIYWPESLAREWTDWYLGTLDTPGGHKAQVRGLCVLLPQKQLIEMVKKIAPTETKINWTKGDDIQLNLRKQFARNMYLARPLLSPDMVLLYARGDYLQFALPSLYAVLHNLSSAQSREHIAKFLDAPVSLQKHGIRLAFTKLKSEELKRIFSGLWKSTKNSSIRSELFKQTYHLLCREKNSSMIEEIWKLLNEFIDNLSQDEDKTIIKIMGEVDKVPLAVRARFYMKSYNYLKSLPAKANCQSIIESIDDDLVDSIELLDSDFVSEILLETLDKEFLRKSYRQTDLLSSYLLCAKDQISQTQRYEKVLSPLLERCFYRWKQLNSETHWKQKADESYFARTLVTDIVEQLSSDVEKYALEKKMVLPFKMFEEIQTKLEGTLSIEDNYILLRSWKLTVAYVKLLEGQQSKIASITGHDRWHEVYLKIAPQFAEICVKYLKEDVEAHFSSIFFLYAKALKYMISNMNIAQTVYLETLKCMLEWNEFIESYLVVINVLPIYLIHGNEEFAKISEIRKKIGSHPSPEVKMQFYCNEMVRLSEV